MKNGIDSSLIDRLIELAIAIQQIPAPPFGETQRGLFVASQFESEGLSDVETDDTGNVYARLPGRGETLPLVVSAHLDTVFPLETDLGLSRDGDKISAPGIGDNSLGVAGLFGLVWALGRESLPGDLWLVANVGEEGLGNLRGMRALLDRFGERILAYLVLEGMGLGHVYNCALGVKRYRITINTPGGHSWADYGTQSAVHELAALITQLTALSLPEEPRTSLNVGVIEGGTTVNSIASEAHLELDLRSQGKQALEDLDRKVGALVKAAEGDEVSVIQEVIGQRPAGSISTSHPLVRLAVRSLEKQGIAPSLTVGSTDANIPLSRGLPAICLGISTGAGAHTLNEYIHTQPLSQGLEQLVYVVRRAYQDLVF
jgi:tripeptide aminopeptidase